MSLLPLLVCFSCPRILILLIHVHDHTQEYWSSSIFLLLIHVHDRTLISFPPLSSKDNSYICSFLSPFVINDHKRAKTTWNLPCEDQWLPLEVVPCTYMVTTWIPFVGNHMKRLWFDTKSWTWVDSWVLKLHFWWTLSIWLKLTPLVVGLLPLCQSVCQSTWILSYSWWG